MRNSQVVAGDGWTWLVTRWPGWPWPRLDEVAEQKKTRATFLFCLDTPAVYIMTGASCIIMTERTMISEEIQ